MKRQPGDGAVAWVALAMCLLAVVGIFVVLWLGYERTMLIFELLQKAAVSEPVKTRIRNALALERVRTVEDLIRYLADEQCPDKPWRNSPRAILERVPNIARKSVDILLPLIDPYLNPTLRQAQETTAMNFEQELRELITAALDAGVESDTIIEALEERAAFLAAQEEAEEEDDET